MSLATLWNVPRNDELWNQFSFSNARHHYDIADALAQKKGVAIPRYPLDPLPLSDSRVWLQNHQIIHTLENGILGIDGFDISDVDVRKEDELLAWIFLHAQMHMQAAQILGVD